MLRLLPGHEVSHQIGAERYEWVGSTARNIQGQIGVQIAIGALTGTPENYKETL